MLEIYQARHPTPFAVLGIRTAGDTLAGIDYLPKGAATLDPISRFAERVCRQIERYLDDPAYDFDLPFDYRGSEFQCRVWRAIRSIPSGRTLTYLDVARRLGTAPRPVGGACGANRIPLVIPCHRVVGSGGIGGFMHVRRGPGIEIKRWLLRHERAEAVMGDG
jgi:methylated-DNA-[protein]-cysteine S-methyltransferase